MKKYSLTNEQARNFILLKQGLLGEYQYQGKQGVHDFIRNTGCIQFDPVDVCGRNPELVLQARVENFNKDMLYQLLYVDRSLIDYYDKHMAIYCVEDWKYFSRTRQYYKTEERNREIVDAVTSEVKQVIKDRGFISTKDLKYNEKLDWYWGPTSLARVALETLYFRGDLLIHHRKGVIRYYSLAEDYIDKTILNADDPNQTQGDYYKWRTLRRIGSVGLLWNKPSDAWLGIGGFKSNARNQVFSELQEESKIIEIAVEGIPTPLYILPEDESLINKVVDNDLLPGRIEFIAPLDNLMWDRNLIRALFNFSYKWEIYTQLEQRKYGYYVLPVLAGNRFIGRIEFGLDKKVKQLRVLNFWCENGFELNPDIQQKMHNRILQFARFNQCEYFQTDW